MKKEAGEKEGSPEAEAATTNSKPTSKANTPAPTDNDADDENESGEGAEGTEKDLGEADTNK